MIIQTRKPLVEKPRFSIRYEIIYPTLMVTYIYEQIRYVIETTNEMVHIIILLTSRQYYIVTVLLLANPYL